MWFDRKFGETSRKLFLISLNILTSSDNYIWKLFLFKIHFELKAEYRVECLRIPWWQERAEIFGKSDESSETIYITSASDC